MLSKIDDIPFESSLGSDNHSGVHPHILDAIVRSNRGHAHSYGMDPVSDLAQKEFDRVFGKKTFVHYVFNGTAANVLCMSAHLKRYEAVICSEQAHVQLDECGAPEVTGHTKLFPLPSEDGKIHPEQALKLMQRQGDQHHSQIKMVSLTQPTELGVCYSLQELKQWRAFCDQHGLYLHCDGTRLANALHTTKTSLKEMATFFDCISFGGSKNGLLGAEAVVSFNAEKAQEMKFYRKQFLNLPSKTRFLAAQFLAYLEEDFYLTLAEHVCREAQFLKERLEEFPEALVSFPVQSNAVFVQFPKTWLKPLKEKFFFYIWDVDKSMARLMISFDWNFETTNAFIEHLHQVKKANP